jgi:hypothetical protein
MSTEKGMRAEKRNSGVVRTGTPELVEGKQREQRMEPE